MKKKARRGRPPGRRKKMRKYKPHLLTGVRDILPEEQRYFDYILEKGEELARSYGFEKITLPVLEEAGLFKRGTGSTIHLNQKDMFAFEDLAGEKICLRPDGRTSAIRVYVAHEMINLMQPIKFFYQGQVFHLGKNSMGHKKELHQFGLDIIGSNKPVSDAQIILFTWNLLQSLGLKFNIQINSLGCLDCRKIYRKKLIDFLRGKKSLLCKECRRRFRRNPFKVFACQDEHCKKNIAQAPQMIDFLCEECRANFVRTLEFLDELGVTYTLNQSVIHNLESYNQTIFNVYPVVQKPKEPVIQPASSKDKKNESENNPEPIIVPSPLAAGGRYNPLMEMFGGKLSGGCGVTFDLENIVAALKNQQVRLPKIKGPQIFLAQLSDLARQNAIRLFENLRKEGFRVAENVYQDSLKNQLEIAHKVGARICLILGQQEVLHKTIIIRDLTSASQETVDQDKIMKELRKRLK